MQAALAPYVAPLVAVAEAPTATPEQILADFTAAIPDVGGAPGPQPALNVRAPDGSKALSFKLPTAASVFSALERLPLGRRLLQGRGPPDPAAGAESLRQAQQDYTGGPLVTSDNGLTTTSYAAPVQTQPQPLAAPAQTLPAPAPRPEPAQAPAVVEAAALPLPQPVAFAPLAAPQPVVTAAAAAPEQAPPTVEAAPAPLPQPAAFAPLAAPQDLVVANPPTPEEAAPQLPAPVGLGALAPAGAVLPADAPQPQLVAPGPAIASGPVAEGVKEFTEKLANYVGFQVGTWIHPLRWASTAAYSL